MPTYILLSEKNVHRQLLVELKRNFPHDSWVLIDSKNDFNHAAIKELNPDKIFVPSGCNFAEAFQLIRLID